MSRETVKHTPGPWITFQPRGDGSVPVRTDGLGLTICYVHDGAICDARANARLIAAAPDLLSALEDAVSLLEMAGCSTVEHRTAIAKATGGSHDKE